jgi:hypothetical protein
VEALVEGQVRVAVDDSLVGDVGFLDGHGGRRFRSSSIRGQHQAIRRVLSKRQNCIAWLPGVSDRYPGVIPMRFPRVAWQSAFSLRHRDGYYANNARLFQAAIADTHPQL